MIADVALPGLEDDTGLDRTGSLNPERWRLTRAPANLRQLVEAARQRVRDTEAAS